VLEDKVERLKKYVNAGYRKPKVKIRIATCISALIVQNCLKLTRCFSVDNKER
jgi:hypothetical protein